MGLGYWFLPWLAWAITLSATGSAATAVILDPSPEQLSRWQGRPPCTVALDDDHRTGRRDLVNA